MILVLLMVRVLSVIVRGDLWPAVAQRAQSPCIRGNTTEVRHP
jgi:hypothetical protein